MATGDFMNLQIYLKLSAFLRSLPVIHKIVWKIRKKTYAVQRIFIVRRAVIDAAPHLMAAISTSAPYAAGKMGSVESAALYAYLKRKKARNKGLSPKAYKEHIFHNLHMNAGVFPKEEVNFDAFAEAYLDAVKQCDMLVSWDVAGEPRILAEYAKNSVLVKFRTLEPFFSDSPWSALLADKRVLVISPFVQSISEQYAFRKDLWKNPALLPSFELLTVRAPLSAALVPPVDTTWRNALERLKSEMDGISYDIALIGAGAYSLPLAAHAKKCGKIGIHLGGSLQFLFGVAGERWKRDAAYRGFITDKWRKPSPVETPPMKNAIENGCYW